jgi:hypothetical protein
MWTEVSRGIAALGHQLGGDKQGAIFVLNLLLHIRAVYYELGVCAGACNPLRTMIDTYQATISCFHLKVFLKVFCNPLRTSIDTYQATISQKPLYMSEFM